MGESVAVEAVSKRYGSVAALSGVTLRVGRGVFIIMGPNGSGKSTLLSIIAGAEKPDSGVVRVLGHDPWREQHKLAGRVSALLDRVGVHPWITGLTLLRAVSSVRGVDWGDVMEVAKTLSVTGYWFRPYASYSTGMRRKLLLAAALAGYPELIILDEPLQGLDSGSVSIVVELVAEAGVQGSTVIVATHIAPRSLVEAATGAALMLQGKVVEVGGASEIAEGYRSAFGV